MSMFQKVIQRKSEFVMLIAGLFILVSVITILMTGNFIFWQIAKGFYAVGVILIFFDK